MRAVGVQDIGDRQVEIALVERQPGEARRGDGDAVIALDAADDLLLLGPAERIVAIPDHLDRGVVRLRAGIGEEGLRHRRSEEHTSELQSLMRLSYAVFCL